MTVRRLIIGMLTLLVIAAVMAPSLMAQSLVSGDLTGTVTDPSGAVVSGATVTAKSDANGSTRTTTTSASGTYRFSLLSPGSYTVTVTAQGFSKTESTTQVNVGQAAIADMKMAIGANAQTVEVTSAAPLVSADNADLSTNFDQNVIQNAPNGGNDLTYVAQTAPGINMNTGMGQGNFNTAGLPSTSNLFTVNGENDMDPYLNLNNSGATNLTLGKNDVQEATVTTNAYSGQYGQQAGAQVSYVTKSGTNQFHGNAEYWWTGSAMDANDYFNNLSGTSRPFANNNEWAASLGGPIKKDKLFFFADTEGIRYIVPSTQTVFSPTVGFANATLANLAVTNPAELPLYSKMFSLYQAAPGYGNGVPVAGTCLDLTSLAGNCFQKYSANPALPGTEYIISGRVDYNLSDKDHMFWRVRMDHGTQATYADPINSAFNAASYQPAYDGQGQWTHTFGSNATNQFVYAGSYYRAIFTQTGGANSVFPLTVDLAPLGYTNMGNNLFNFPQGRNVTQYQLVDDFSLTKGAHNLKFGANFRRYDLTDYTFSILNNPLAVIAGPSAMTEFFNGNAFQFLQNFPSRATEPVALWGIGMYAQDEWRVNKSLKLTLALRAEHNSNPNCNLNCASYLDGAFLGTSTNPATPYNQMIVANQSGVFRGTDAINLAPRFGFAWSPGGSDKTVVRGGFGLFYDAFPAVYGDLSMTNIPNQVNEALFGASGVGIPWADQTTPAGAWSIASSSAAAIRNGFASGASFNSLSAALPGFSAPNINTFAGTFQTPRYQEWSLQLEQQLDNKSSVTLAYVGNHGVNIPAVNYPNAFAGVAGLPAAPFSPSFASVQEVYSGAVSNSNGLTASYQRRLTYGFTVSASYTWSHSLDDDSNNGVLGSAYNALTSVQYQINPLCLACNNYGNADYDIRNSFNAQYVWNTPWKFGNKFVNGAFGGWTLSQNFFGRSGLPLTVLDSTSTINNYNGGTPNFPAQVIGAGQGSCNQYGAGCLVSSGFATANTLSAFPNQIRNQYRGPGFFDSDFSVNKNFKLTEKMSFGLGANLYNVFNHPNFASPVNAFGAGNFGQVLQTTAPPTGPYGAFFTGLPSGRIVQFQGKLVF
ncbi:MAG: carboxypeptidase regulatory-like domain-containing protein [Candidatus Korobacteraceae bacterium]